MKDLDYKKIAISIRYHLENEKMILGLYGIDDLRKCLTNHKSNYKELALFDLLKETIDRKNNQIRGQIKRIENLRSNYRKDAEAIAKGYFDFYKLKAWCENNKADIKVISEYSSIEHELAKKYFKIFLK